MKFGHTAISVKNLARSVAFYGKFFGLKCSEKYTHKKIGLTIAVLRKENVALEFFEFKKCIALPGYRKTLDSDLKTIGVKHFSFGVVDIKGVFKRFKKARVKFETDLSVFDNGKHYFFIKDPDGILVEIMEA